MSLSTDLSSLFTERCTLPSSAISSQQRNTAYENFLKIGFPTKKDEEYKYTNLKELLEVDYSIATIKEHGITKEKINALGTNPDFYKIVFINGVFSDDFSVLPSAIDTFFHLDDPQISLSEIKNKVEEIVPENLAFTQLNTAFFTTGMALVIPKNTIIDKPIELFYLSTNQDTNVFYNQKNILLVEEGAKVEIIEQIINLDASTTFTNTVSELYVDKNAHASWHKIQDDAKTNFLIDHTFVKQEKDSVATVNTFSFGNKLIRNNLHFIQNGENIYSYMNGITLIGQDQTVDHHTAVHHNQPNCESYQNYKGIYKKNAHGIFNGKVFVNKVAQKTNAYQQNNNILLDQGATIDTKPQLEIFADDVKCSHGCTVGQLNEEALFYLRARGISKKEAQGLLLFAFANDAMQNIENPSLKTKISGMITQNLDVSLAFEEE